MRLQRHILFLCSAFAVAALFGVGLAAQEPNEPRSWRSAGGLGELGEGAFLAASRRLQDPNFARSAVFLIEVGDEGAMGVIINRPTGIPIAEALPEVTGLPESAPLLYIGGPVEPGVPIFLARTKEPLEGSRMVLEGEVSVLTSSEAVESLFADPASSDSVRVFAGYAGWAPGQLEKEVERGDWHVLSVGSEWIFGEGGQRIWEEMLDIVFRPTA